MTPADARAVAVAMDWLLAEAGRTPQMLAAVLRLGLADPYDVAAQMATDPVQSAELIALAAARPQPWDRDPQELLDTIGVVGARVWDQDPDNAGAWALVGRRVQDVRDVARTWPYRGRTEDFWRLSVPHIVAGFLDAGRGPSYAQQMLTAAEQAHIAPDTFGYGPDITPATLVGLAGAGVHDADQLNAYLLAGASAQEALTLAEQRVSHAAVAWAAANAIPADQWLTLAGLPAHWFPSPAGPDQGRGGLIAHGFTVADMRFLLEHGWEDLRPYEVSGGIRYAPRQTSAPLTPTTVRTLAQLGPKDIVTGWWAALTSGKGGTDVRDQALPPLTRYPARDIAASVACISELTGAGLRPSHLNTYRAAGCRSVADVLAAVRAGVTPKRAKELLEAKGERSASYRPLRFRSLHALLGAHRDVTVTA